MHGIVIIETYSYNKWVNTLYAVVTSLSYILPKCVKTREPKDKHCVLWCTYVSYYTCNPKNFTTLPYITWALVWDLKIKKEILTEIKFEKSQNWDRGIPINKFYWTAIWDFKNKRKNLHTDKPWRKEENPSCPIHCGISFWK